MKENQNKLSIRALGLALFLLFSLTGCDVPVKYQFKVANDSGYPVTIRYSTPQIADTFLTLAASGELLIYEKVQTNRGVEPYFQDSIWWFDSFSINMNDSIPAQKNLKLVENWTFTKINGSEGQYRLQLVGDDFK